VPSFHDGSGSTCARALVLRQSRSTAAHGRRSLTVRIISAGLRRVGEATNCHF
jgi:hypothetical protein